MVFVRLLRTADQRLWLALGGAIGIGLETKLTIAALPMAILVALLLTPTRGMLQSAWPWAAAAIALALFAPNLVWQATHDWITVQYTLSDRGHTDGPVAYWVQQLFLIGPVFVVPGVAGLWALRKDERLAPIFFVVAAVELIFFLAGGKSYYVGPVVPVFYAAGTLWLDSRLRSMRSVSLSVAAAVAVTLVLLPISVPILPTQAFVDSGLWKARKDFANMLGGPELARKTAAAYYSIPSAERPGAMIVAHYYGEAGPINLYGPPLGLPQAVSPHLSFWYWAPPRMDPQTVVLVGFTTEEADRYFADCRQAQTITNDYGIENDFSGNAILVCTQPREPLWKAWPSLQTLD